MLQDFYELDINNIIILLEDYIYSRNSFERFNSLCKNNDRVYGINIYKVLIDNVNSQVINDVRILNLLWEHKKCMTERIEYLSRQEIIEKYQYEFFIDKFKSIENKAFLLRNLQLKYNISKQKIIVEKIIILLEEIAHDEKDIITQLINYLIDRMKSKEPR